MKWPEASRPIAIWGAGDLEQLMSSDELLPLVDSEGRVIGRALRSEVHGDPRLVHPVVHCLVTDARGDVLLQLRGRHKDVQPGRWDTSVGGHVGLAEAIETAMVREVGEELGLAVNVTDLEFLYRYVMRSEIETELVYTYRLASSGPFRAEPGEIEALRFWSRDEIEAAIGSGALTPNFEDEFRRYLAWLDRELCDKRDEHAPIPFE
jgi:isopentenyldiphosphate isomerase